MACDHDGPSTNKEAELHSLLRSRSLHGQRASLLGSVYSVLWDNVGGAIADLNADNCLCSIDVHHREQVHNRMCAPTDHRPHLCGSDLAGDGWVSFGMCGLCRAIEEHVHNVHEENHGQSPAHPRLKRGHPLIILDAC